MATISFDLNGTLLDPGEQTDVLQDAVHLAMAHTLAGDFRPFAELLEAAGGEVPDELPPFPDVVTGLDRLAAAGHRLSVPLTPTVTADVVVDRLDDLELS